MNYPGSFIQYCTTLGVKLTSLRKEVLYILWQAKKPLKAYEILDLLLQIKPNSKPPTVYRALSFFVMHGIAHKIESIQSYTLCCEPEKHLYSEVVMVCDDCHQVIEVYDAVIQSLVLKLADNNHFKLKQDIIELKGICQHCLP
ncbi:Fur family transcriptional regulator [Legionella nagasakiensis]|uniref:Fur family transcriptional regulator n=1 Tax=Legionella nagasakiensis TaxID=535290 RepID=UPI0010555083|nr:transcriptional repressor [Legionella nagasakiensis]